MSDKINKVSVIGYKGVEDLELEPGRFNLITGRNNTGKTSFLQSLELLYRPTRISGYSRNIDSLINRDYNKATLTGQIDDETEEIILKYIDKKEAKDNLMMASKKSLFHRNQLEVRLNDLRDNLDADYEFKVKDVLDSIEEAFEDVIQERITEIQESKIQDNFLVVKVNDRSHIFYNIGALQPLFRDREEIRKDILDNERLDEYEEIVKNHLIRDFVFRHPHNRSGFLSKPATRENLKFIRSAKFDRVGLEKDEEDNAVKIDDIGDYIKENGILDNLKTFDLDSLVFKEDGQKYQIPFEFMGDGFKSIVGFLWRLIDEKENKVVLVEEPENHMHPGYIRELVSFLVKISKEEDIQLFITTHDNDFINEFFADHFNEEEKEFLKEELRLFQFKTGGFVEEFDYVGATEHLKDLQIDLRGL
ncbi:MAG: ATP-binding protein [Nanohaloarchaea archaeon]|nr:ATP-binding protein [Candidatus Nanohaloarchaea archaeon]